jgi:hypothetical protein
MGAKKDAGGDIRYDALGRVIGSCIRREGPIVGP